ncbi:permease [Homoserinibacter sp. YIM 151385]|uniref:permease n=1 Tax=Homoserinibacter sp. YIM 151385 TaxID=2985506 RepID=UPI0022EFF952|nr:permease [Homoserinibacter sp. YIM 151385]WBU37940.1 permease [Homoserinibacter sp. YIM 151385]
MPSALLDPPRPGPGGRRGTGGAHGRHAPRDPRRGRTLPTRILLVAGLVATLAAIRLVAPGELALEDAVQDGITLATSVVVESLPFVFLGLLLSIAVQLWVPSSVLMRILPRRALPRRAVLSLLGVLLPVCECGNVPLARGFVMRGLTVPDAMTFLLAAPILNPVTIITTYQAFGLQDGILVWRVVGGFLVANGIGWLLSRHPEPDRLLTPSFQAACAHDAGSSQRASLPRAARMFAAETTAMLPALLVGSAIAGLIQVAVQRDLLVQLGQHPVLSVLALMALAFVISICSNVDAFFVLSLGSAFSPGAIIAFLVFGPMIDIKMLALMRTTFTARTLAVVASAAALATAVIGLGVNLAG